jgi:proteasome lid subunit RPN8/RPN11
MSQVTWYLPDDLLRSSIEIMRPHGARGNEGLALWLGTSDDAAKQVTVTHAIEVYGPGFVTAPLHMRLSFRAMSTLTDLADRLGCYLVGQIHSHPANYIDLSDVDREFGIRVQDYLSLVCPHYAQRPDVLLSDCGLHAFEGTNYRRLSTAEASRRVIETSQRVSIVRCEVHHD